MGKQNGHGTVTSPYGKYVGEWKGNDFHGQETYTWSDGTNYEGEWKDGIEWKVTIYDKDGEIDGRVWIGVRQFCPPLKHPQSSPVRIPTNSSQSQT